MSNIWTPPNDNIKYKQLHPDNPYAQGLVGYWRMTEGSGNTVYDWSNYNNNGILVNGPEWAAGEDGGAVRFDGALNCRMNLPDPVALTTATPFTVIIRFRLDDATVDNMIVSQRDSGDNFFIVYCDDSPNELTFVVKGNVNAAAATLTAPQSNQWYTLVGVYDGAGTSTLYIDGEYIDSASASMSGDIVGNWYIGDAGNPIGKEMAGQVEVCGVYDRALPAKQIAAISADPTLPIWRPRGVSLAGMSGNEADAITYEANYTPKAEIIKLSNSTLINKKSINSSYAITRKGTKEVNSSYGILDFDDWVIPNRIFDLKQRTLGLFNPSDRTNKDFDLTHRTNKDFNVDE